MTPLKILLSQICYNLNSGKRHWQRLVCSGPWGSCSPKAQTWNRNLQISLIRRTLCRISSGKNTIYWNQKWEVGTFHQPCNWTKMLPGHFKSEDYVSFLFNVIAFWYYHRHNYSNWSYSACVCMCMCMCVGGGGVTLSTFPKEAEWIKIQNSYCTRGLPLMTSRNFGKFFYPHLPPLSRLLILRP